ncbi:MAG: hypothetical protein J7L73_02825 [Anaerolineales bacterium]|nr:hypothetical protein [Anaerolineales bacterium]
MKGFWLLIKKRSLVPIVNDVGGIGGLQTITKKESPSYWKLIKKFEKLTRVPVVLNTSFNENEPIVCTPDEALDCFLRSKMDILVLENWMITKEE